MRNLFDGSLRFPLALLALSLAACPDIPAGNNDDERELECGNGDAERGERCDGDDVGAETCDSLGFGTGTTAAAAAHR